MGKHVFVAEESEIHYYKSRLSEISSRLLPRSVLQADRYERKPYIGILVQENDIEYVIPLSSAKEKHRSWKNVDTDRFLIRAEGFIPRRLRQGMLIFENCEKMERGSKGIYMENADGTFKHILSVMDLKKEIKCIDLNMTHMGKRVGKCEA